MLDRKYRINQEKDYNYIYKNAKRISGRYIIVFITRNNLQYNRFGIVTSKKVGNAVKRNRAKRRIRELSKKHMESINKGYDLVFVSRVSINEADFDQIEKDFLSAMRKARIL